jgi:hypothetical protein
MFSNAFNEQDIPKVKALNFIKNNNGLKQKTSFYPIQHIDIMVNFVTKNPCSHNRE